MVEEDEQIGWLKFKEKKFEDTTRARGLSSVKTEPRLTQVKNMLYRNASISEPTGGNSSHLKLREVINHKAERRPSITKPKEVNHTKTDVVI